MAFEEFDDVPEISSDALLALTEVPSEKVKIPPMPGLPKGGYAWVYGMTGKERDTWETGLLVGKGKNRKADTTNIRARLLIHCLRNSHGEKLFSDTDATREMLGKIRADVIGPLYDVAQRLSGVSDSDVEELGQPSKPEDGGTSSSASPKI